MGEFFTYLAITGLVFWWSLILVPWRPCSTREQLEADDISVNGNAALDNITVLIPARNEGELIKHTLQALAKQGTGLNIIVIDDESQDDTAVQAKNFGAQVITGTTPPPGWSGKLWALEQGLDKVHTPYTLLLDADIELTPGIIVTLREKARNEKLALVSLMAEPPLQNYSERMLMPAFIFFFKILYPFSLANKSNSTMAAAAGGCILIETKVLHDTGAFASLHDALIDDCTLAKQVKQAGFGTWIGLSHSARSHRGYSGLKPNWEMVVRTAYTQLRYSPFLLLMATLIMMLMFWVTPFAFLWIPASEGITISVLGWVAIYLCYVPTLIYYRRSTLWVLVLPFIGTHT
jgi:hopene-associated glycosyltransferase HpnB